MEDGQEESVLWRITDFPAYRQKINLPYQWQSYSIFSPFVWIQFGPQASSVNTKTEKSHDKMKQHFHISFLRSGARVTLEEAILF